MQIRAHHPITGTMAWLNSDIPTCPPPEVLAQVDAAWERAQQMQRAGIELSLSVGRFGRRPRAGLRVDGILVAELGVREWLALACGEAP
jgi:hypothetical protein